MNLRQILPPGVVFGTLSLFLAMAPVAPGAPAHTTTRPAATTARGATKTTTVAPAATLSPNDSPATTTAATVPVGYTTIAVTPATDANTPSSTVISVPFYQAAAYAAPVASVDSSTQFSISTAAWTANQYAQTSTPYLVHFQTGSSAGRYFLITSNTTSQITVYSRGYDLTQVAAAADTFEIVPANTLGLLFGTTTVPFQSGRQPMSRMISTFGTVQASAYTFIAHKLEACGQLEQPKLDGRLSR